MVTVNLICPKCKKKSYIKIDERQVEQQYADKQFPGGKNWNVCGCYKSPVKDFGEITRNEMLCDDCSDLYR